MDTDRANGELGFQFVEEKWTAVTSIDDNMELKSRLGNTVRSPLT